MNYEELALDVANRARKAGADEADVWLETSTEFSVQVRGSAIETLTQAGNKGLGLRLFVDGRLGFAATSDFTPHSLQSLIETTLALAQYADKKPENGLVQNLPAIESVNLQLYDPSVKELSTEAKIDMAKRCEAATYSTDPRITNSEGTGFSSEYGETVLANSQGWSASYHSSSVGLYCQPLAEENGKKQVDYDWTSARSVSELLSPEVVGRQGAERVLRKLGARKVPTQVAPIVFERRVAARIWAGVLGAVDGDAIFKGMSYLRNRLGEQIASDKVTLVDDGRLLRGAGSAPFDGEGLPTRRNVIVENGVLKMFLYDTQTARKVGNGTSSTANARRSPMGAGMIGAFNLYLEPGTLMPEEIIASVPNGFYVTDMMGGGLNTVTGDFSIGASGVWIENGQLAYAVEEVTIAGTMDSILKGVERVGNDILFQSSVVSPTFQVAEMTIAGL
jgi:PmbA protein